MSEVKIHPSRKTQLESEFSAPYFLQIKQFLLAEIEAGHTIFPVWKDIFRAFDLTPFDQVKVVILWQDPYHGVGEAHGLSFSVPDGVKIPPSLRNIFKELKSDLDIDPPSSWNLQKRAEQWVFLLNAWLTVRQDAPNSHKDAWRQTFTDAVIQKLSDRRDWLVFILRGAFAQKKLPLIDPSKHLIIKSPHPSPFSADKGFFGSRPFSQCNNYLIGMGKTPIDRKI